MVLFDPEYISICLSCWFRLRVLLRDLLHHQKPRIGGLCDLLVLLAGFTGKKNTYKNGH